MENPIESILASQCKKLKVGLPEIQLVKPCLLNQGIIPLSRNNTHEITNESLTWFIPASGSGSRMFKFLYDFLIDGDLNKKEIKQFSDSLSRFAFYHKIDPHFRDAFEGNHHSLSDFINHILFKEGLNLSQLPKGLVPFHKGVKGISNPFQDSIIQGLKLGNEKIDFHLTIQKEFEKEIIQSINENLIEYLPQIEFTEQYKETDSIAFDDNFNPIYVSDKTFLKRPSGHGALLTNLNRVAADFILIRNIDNIQHSSKSKESINVWKKLVNLTVQIRIELQKIWDNPNKEELLSVNEKYYLYDFDHVERIKNTDEILDLINRPLRICGMVKNSGQPGGGPFWVNSEGKLTKQIVEKAQISSDENQQTVLEKSTHFNPVMIVASVKDFKGKKYDLTKFVDNQSYFIVNKSYEGKNIQYIENPGLWNGSMAHWNTVFVEIPSEVFSPVKTILDLLDERHQE